MCVKVLLLNIGVKMIYTVFLDYRPSNTPLVVAISVSFGLAIAAVVVGIILCCWKKQRDQRAMMDMKMSMMKEELEARYTDLPKKSVVYDFACHLP